MARLRTVSSFVKPGRTCSRARGLALSAALPFIIIVTALGCGSSGHTTAMPETETVTIYPQQTPAADVLLVLQNWSGQTADQILLFDQMPTLAAGLEAAGPLDVHIAVTTPDMGAPGIPPGIGCTPPGNHGAFLSAPTGGCASTGLAAGATFITENSSCITNMTTSVANVLQCIGDVGNGGCGFGQPLAAAVHALGADNIVAGVPTPPATNAAFLRPDAALGILFLSDQDDCSAPSDSKVFSLDGAQNLSNPLGPLGLYRCNQWGHLCKDPASSQPQSLIMPPLIPPADAQGTPTHPMLDLTDCQDNDSGTGLLTPVSALVAQIKALKSHPDNQIVVATISGPPTPYTVEWQPAPGGASTGELWPDIMLSCGPGVVSPDGGQAPSDGTSGEPGVRLAAFANGFPLAVQTSTCAGTYAPTLQTFATKIFEAATGCLTGAIQTAADGTPACTGTAVVQDSTGTSKNVSYPNCAANGNVAPCWTLTPSTDCPGGHLSLNALTPPTSFTLTCTLGKPGAPVVDGGPHTDAANTPKDAGSSSATDAADAGSTFPCGPSGALLCSCGNAPFFPPPTNDAGQPQSQVTMPDAGATNPYTTVAEFDALAVGRWRRTEGEGEIPCEQFGVDITSDLQLIPLVIANDGSVQQVTAKALPFGISNILPNGSTDAGPYACGPRVVPKAIAPEFYNADQSMWLVWAPWAANYVRVN